MTRAGLWQMQPILPPSLFLSSPHNPTLVLTLYLSPSLYTCFGGNQKYPLHQSKVLITVWILQGHLLNSHMVLNQKRPSNGGVLSPGAFHPGSAVWRPAHTPLPWTLLGGAGCIGLSQKSGALSAQPVSLWPPEVSGTETHSVCAPVTRLSPCCTNLGVRANLITDQRNCCRVALSWEF